MKRIFTCLVVTLVVIAAFAQKDVTTFLGIPVDGTKSAMKQKLIAKGYVPEFYCAEFDIIKFQAGLNRFRLSAKEWTEKTNAIGIISKAGRYGVWRCLRNRCGISFAPFLCLIKKN